MTTNEIQKILHVCTEHVKRHKIRSQILYETFSLHTPHTYACVCENGIELNSIPRQNYVLYGKFVSVGYLLILLSLLDSQVVIV